MKRIAAIFLLLPLLLFASLAQAVPTVDEVQSAVKAGRHEQAETMMREVVAAKPESAKAHYVLAELLAHNGRREEALKEVREARRIDPSIKFADPVKFARFEEMLQSPAKAGGSGGAGAYAGPNTGTVAAPGGNPTRSTAATTRGNESSAGSGMPSWIWLVGAAVLGFAAWRYFSSRRTASSAAAPMAAAGMAPGAGHPAAGYPAGPGGVAQGYGGGNVAPGYGPQGQPGMMQGRGPGMMGVGLGVAGGVAAGMLAERMLNGGNRDAPAQSADAGAAAGGVTPGAFDDGMGSADALRDRPIDFGNGGASWDDGGGAADLGSDGGGGGSDDGGW